jgi:hypothetical protein
MRALLRQLEHAALALLRFLNDKVLYSNLGSKPRRIYFAVAWRIGARVCHYKGRCTYTNTSWNSWTAYQCAYCGEWDRPLDSLATAPDDWQDHLDWPGDR